MADQGRMGDAAAGDACRRLPLAVCVVLAWWLTVAPAPAAEEPAQGAPASGWTHAVGVEADLGALAELAERTGASGAAGRGILVWSDLDLEDAYAQDPALASLEEALAPLVQAGLRPCLTLNFSGRALPGPEEPERMKAWELALATLARLGAHEVGAVALALPADPQAAERTLSEVGFLAKRTSVALRTVRRDLPVLLDLPGAPEAWLRPLLGEDVGPHVDGVVLEAPEGADEAWVGRQFETVFRLRPGLRVLVRGWPVDTPIGAVEAYLRGVGAGASGIVFRASGPEQEPDLWTLLGRVRAQIPDGMLPADPVPLRFAGPDGQEVPVAHGRFFDPQAFDVVVWYRPLHPESAPPRAGVTLGTADAVSPFVVDLLSGQERPLSLWLPDPKARVTRFNLVLRDRPLLLRHHQEIRLLGESGGLQVESERIPPVEEILARHQEFQAAQDRRLRRWIAEATIGLHYTVGSAEASFDLTYHSTLYADPEGATEWEHRSLEVNGAPYRAKTLPDLPYVLPERVVQVPLRLTLNKDYTYRLAGSDVLDGAKTWVVEFEPVDATRNLHRGRVWIDATTFARRRLSAVQTRVETPVLSAEDELEFEPLPGEGEPLWILKRSRGQQVLTVSGRNLVLVRDIDFSSLRVNPPDFDQQRAAALASPHFIVREGKEGYQTLDRAPDGTRVPRPSGVQKTLMVLAGVFWNVSAPFPVPLGGVNYFNFKTGGRDLQLEVFAAGAYNFINLTDPQFLGSRWEVGSDLVLRAFPLTDRFLDTGAGGEEIEAFGVDDVSQNLSFNTGRQIGNFFKFTGILGEEYARYSHGSDSPSTFVVPSDTFIHTLEARLEFNRQAFSTRLYGRYGARQSWDAWGFPTASLGTLGLAPAGAAGSLLEEFDAGQRDFAQYGATLSYLWTPGIFQTVRAEAAWMQGSDLDRFSKFRISSWGEVRVRGFGGSGVRFDQGGIARAIYTFKVGPFMRLDASIDHARVRERGLGQGDFVQFTGVGLAGNFGLRGGWIVRLDYGFGAASDLEEVSGEQEIVLELLRIL